MIDGIILVTAIFLLIVSILDIKFRVLPSILVTGFLFVITFIMLFKNPISINLGILGLIMAYFLYEADFFGGVADIKVMTALSFMITTFNYFLGFILLIGLYGLVWKGIIKWKLKGETEYAFLPVFFFVFLTLYFLGGLYRI